MSTLNDCQLSSLAAQGYTTGTANDRLWQWLNDQTGAGTTLRDMWHVLLTNLGYSGSVNDMQLQSWIDMGAPVGSTWNDAAKYFWCVAGGVYGPAVRIVPQGSVPTVGFCDYPAAGNCTATRQYQAVTSGYDSPITSWVWSIEAGTGTITAGQGTDTVTVETQNQNADTQFTLKIVASNADPETAEKEVQYTHYHREDLVASIQENSNPGCTWPVDDPPGCTANASYIAVITGTPTSIIWSLSEITGGTADIISGQGTGSCVVQTTGSTNVSYKLTVDLTSEYQTANDSGTFTQVHKEETSEADFWALVPDETTYEMLGVRNGTGDLTTTHTADLYAPDVEGLYRAHAANNAVWAGGRHVNNYCLESAALTGAPWVVDAQLSTAFGAPDPDGGNTALTVTSVSGAGGWYQNTAGGYRGVVRNSVWVRRRTGTGTIELDTGNTVERVDITSQLTSSWQRFVTEPGYTSGGTGRRCLVLVNTIGDEVDVWHPQSEELAINGYGADLITQWDFNASTGWNLGTGWTISGGRATCDGTQGGNTDLTHSLATNQGTLLAVRVNVLSISAGTLTMYVGGSGSAIPLSEGITEVYTNTLGALNLYLRGDASFVGQLEYARVQLPTYAGGDVVSEYVEAGANPVATAYASQNGNTVSGNIVTEAVGDPLPDMPYLQYYPAAQNEFTYSRDLTETGWNTPATGTVTYDQVGLTGESNTASRVTATNGANSGFKALTVTADTNEHTFVWWVKKTTSAVSHPSLLARISSETGYYGLNTDTGVLTLMSGQTAATATEVIDDGDWWKVLIQRPGDGASTTYYHQYKPGASTDGGPTETPGLSADTTFGNFEIHLNKTIAQVRGLGPIFTTTAAVATDRVIYTMDIANHADDSAYYVEWFNQTLVAGTGSPGGRETGLVGVGNNGRILTARDGALVTQRAAETSDNAFNTSSLGSQSWAQDTAYKEAVAADMSDAQFAVNLDGSYGPDTTFTGWVGTSIMLAKASDFVNTISYSLRLRNLQRYDTTSLAEAKTIIDSLMLPQATFVGGDIIDLTVGDT